LGIGPRHPVDGSDPASVRAALKNEIFGDLISDEYVSELCRQGWGHALFSLHYPTWRYGIDKVTYPCVLLAPTIEELEALEDKERLALIIRDLNIRGTSPRLERLIRSTIEPEWTWIGETVQDHLHPQAMSPSPPVKGKNKKRRPTGREQVPDLFKIGKVRK
jgi:hypothetical protein